MAFAICQTIPWEDEVTIDIADAEVSAGDFLIVKSGEFLESGKIVRVEKEQRTKNESAMLERLPTTEDYKAIKANYENKKEAMDYCEQLADQLGLVMKIIDVHFSFDGQRISFAFGADGRVDFRELVKELTRHFKKMVRLHQVGARDEVKLTGDMGPCGRNLCCRGPLDKLESISSDLAEKQNIAHRGSERLSGPCGRLKCCLAFEAKMYDELASKLPPVGTKVRTDHGRGEVIGWNIIKSSVKVRLNPEKAGETGAVVEIEIKK